MPVIDVIRNCSFGLVLVPIIRIIRGKSEAAVVVNPQNPCWLRTVSSLLFLYQQMILVFYVEFYG